MVIPDTNKPYDFGTDNIDLNGGSDGYGDSFSERITNGDLWLKAGSDFLFGDPDDGKIIGEVPSIPVGKKLAIKGLQLAKNIPKLVQAMRNGTYEYNAARGIIAGYKDTKGIYYISDGHHRIAAAQEILRTTGNSGPLNLLIKNGRWNSVTAAPAGARPLPSTSMWGSFRNWLGY